MIRIFLLLIASLVSFITVAAAPVSDSDVERALNRLDKELSRRQTYITRKNATIDSLRAAIENAPDYHSKIDAEMKLGELFSGFDNDSALIYFTRGYDNATARGDTLNAIRFRLRRAVILPLSGFLVDAINEFEDIDTTALPKTLLPFYHEAGRQMYSYISSCFTAYPPTSRYWQEKSSRHSERLLAVSDTASTAYALNRGELLYRQGDYYRARKILNDLTRRLDESSNQYARACHMLASIAAIEGNENEQTYYLAQSAIADIRGAILEVMSLQELGVLISESDINRAYNYLCVALNNAVDCKATMRIVQSSAALPLIQAMHSEQQAAWQRILYIIVAILVVFLVTLCVLLFTITLQMKKMKRLKTRLEDSNRVKEVYISQFFRLCSIYIDKLNQFCKIANRKISAGQVDEFYKMTKSGKLVEEQSEEFYKLFDDAFLHIYPTFVEEVNRLLREPIVLKEGELLNNDLRILAFMRLGLEDTNQVALILNYSVNTIYSYRNKLRNRAINRDTFEAEIMRIGAV